MLHFGLNTSCHQLFLYIQSHTVKLFVSASDALTFEGYLSPEINTPSQEEKTSLNEGVPIITQQLWGD